MLWREARNHGRATHHVLQRPSCTVRSVGWIELSPPRPLLLPRAVLQLRLLLQVLVRRRIFEKSASQSRFPQLLLQP